MRIIVQCVCICVNIENEILTLALTTNYSVHWKLNVNQNHPVKPHHLIEHDSYMYIRLRHIKDSIHHFRHDKLFSTGLHFVFCSMILSIFFSQYELGFGTIFNFILAFQVPMCSRFSTITSEFWIVWIDNTHTKNKSKSEVYNNTVYLWIIKINKRRSNC